MTQQSNTPSMLPKLKKEQGKTWIFDSIRKKYIVLTPEEWVRQHFIHYLINTMSYPKALFRIEKKLTYNTLQKRSDIVVYDRSAQPWMLVECKSAAIKLTQKAFNQISIYNMAIGAKYLAVTNGTVYYCWRAIQNQGEEIVLLDQLPPFP